MTRRIAATGTALALAATLTACSTEAPGSAPADEASPSAESASSVAAHNDADTEFAQMMIVHHEGALEMADLAVAQAGSEEVRSLGERIAGAQDPEIELMTSWLQQWEEDLPADADMGAMDHGSMEMDGMDQEAVMAELESLSGADFDRRFLELMTDHHRGAIEMADQHLEDGDDPASLELARVIIDAQAAEITEMENLRKELSS